MDPDMKPSQYREKFPSHLDFVEDNSSSMDRRYGDKSVSPMAFGNIPPQQQVYDDSNFKGQVTTAKSGPMRAFSPPLNQHTMPGHQPPRANSTPPVHNLGFNSPHAENLDYMNGDPSSLARQFSDLDMNVSRLPRWRILCGKALYVIRLAG